MAAVSILLPTFNRAALLQECLDSLLATTVPCEIIVSNNGSEDETRAILDAYDDPRLKVFHQPENIGVIPNHNFLLAQASKDYICLFGDDDIALPGCFEQKLALLDHNPDVAGVYSLSRIMDDLGTLSPCGKVNGVPDFCLVTGRDEFAHLIMNCCISWQTLVFRRELYVQYGDLSQPEITAIDWDYLIAISKDRHFAFINEPTVGIRVHAQSHSNTVHRKAGKMVDDTLFIWRKWLLEADDYPVLTGNTWNTMATMLQWTVQMCWGKDDTEAQKARLAFDALRSEYEARMNRHFYAGLNQWLPGRQDVDADGLPVFRPGLPPLSFDSRKRVHFFHHPQWAGNGWREVVSSYVQAFTADDDVELILWLDPAQGVDVSDAGSRIIQHLIDQGIDPQAAADMQLLTEELDLAGEARLYAAMKVIVPAGDTRQLDRGCKLGSVVMTQTLPVVWRNVAAMFLGKPVASQA